MNPSARTKNSEGIGNRYWRVACAVAMMLCLGFADPAVEQLAEVDPLEVVVDADMRKLVAGSTNHGTGFHIDNRGHAVTAAHVVAGCRNIMVSVENGVASRARLLGFDAQRDLALISVHRSEVWFDVTAKPPVTEDLVVFAGAGGDRSDWRFLPARLGPRFQSGLFELGSFSPALAPGASGGPVLDGRGLVVGMSVGTIVADGPLTLAVGGRDLLGFLAYMDIKPPPRRLSPPDRRDQRISQEQLSLLRAAALRIDCA